VTVTVTATRTATPVPACPGDCGGDGVVTIDELTRGVRIALGEAPLSLCPAADADGDRTVAVPDLVRAVSASLEGC